MTTLRIRAAMTALLLPLVAPAQDQPAPDARAALHACAVLEPVPARLECIDRVLAEATAESAEREDTSPASAAAGGDGERSVVVVGVDDRVPGRAVFVTEQGERFVQTSGGSRLRLPSVPFDAVLRPGFGGSTFLSPDGRRSAVRVTAVED